MPSGNSSKPYLAFDFGAESGRAILVHLRSGVLTTQEIHRFKNEPVEYGGSLHWDIARLWWEVRKALSNFEETPLAGIGVDAWGSRFQAQLAVLSQTLFPRIQSKMTESCLNSLRSLGG